MGFDVLLIGRKQRRSLSMDHRTYAIKRMILLFEKGPLFYFFFQLRLFFLLLFTKTAILHTNDLDTLLPNYLVARIKRIPLVYDSHEYFTEVPELQANKLKKAVWKRIEKWIFPRLKYVITVNDSIANLYKEEYGNEVAVMRNVPKRITERTWKTKAALKLSTDKKIIILQGAGINVDRGAEEAVAAMQYIENAILLIVGGGDVLPLLKNQVKKLNLTERVIFIPKQSYEELIHYTHIADIGLSLDKNTNINYQYSLPNKLFDYIHAGIAVLASPLVEVKKVVEQYQVGVCVENHQARHIADLLNKMMNSEMLNQWKTNSKKAALELCWENEVKILEKIYKSIAG